MACAVAMPVPHKFKGDSSELVDRLIAVSNARPSMPGPMKVRELQPFDFADAPPLPKAGRPSPPKRSPRTSPPKQQKAAGGQRNKTASPNSDASPCRGSLDGRTPVAKASPSKAHFQSLDDDLVKVLRNNLTPTPSGRACPGFFSSPSPTDIPMPTSSLLVRAIVKA